MIDPLVRERDRIRRSLLAERDRLSPVERQVESERIIATLTTLPFFSKKQHFFIYCHYRSEVWTDQLFARCLEQGKTVSVPLTQPEQMQMTAVVIIDPVQDLAPGYKGIPEPLPALARNRLLLPATIEVAVIPGAVFDRSGHRLGYGLGFYDRFLVQAPQAIRIGLAFSCQVVDRVPAQDHDVPMDMIVTEKEILTWPRRTHASDRGL